MLVKDDNLAFLQPISAIATIGTLIYGIGNYVIFSRDYAPPIPSGFVRCLFILFLGGVLAAGLHAVSWRFTERYYGTQHLAGGASLPTGWLAVLLSVSITGSISIVVPVWATLSGIYFYDDISIYCLASIAMIVCGGVGHLLLYGTD